MNRRGIVFLALALAMGTAAAWFTQGLVADPSQPGASVATTPVVVLRTDVAVATSLTREHLRTTDWPTAHVPPGALASTTKTVSPHWPRFGSTVASTKAKSAIGPNVTKHFFPLSM